MATGSIYNNIKITNKKFCRSLVNALEDSKENNGKTVAITKSVNKMSKEQIEKVFGEKTDV